MIWMLTAAFASDPSLHRHMADHLKSATAARDAVVQGDFERARAHLRALATHAPVEGMPARAQTYVAGLQAEAKKGAEAKSLEAVGEAVARVAHECGECHRTLQKGPDFGPIGQPADGDDVKTHMARHQWAADRMWQGLVAADSKRWDAGALFLVEEPWVKRDAPHDDPEVAAFAARIHEAGVDALLTWHDAQRARLYGGFIATCARCHQVSNDGAAE